MRFGWTIPFAGWDLFIVPYREVFRDHPSIFGVSNLEARAVI
jgi:hypothetical protein